MYYWWEVDKQQWQSVGERERQKAIGGLKYQWNSFSFATVFQQYYMIGDRKWGHAYQNLKSTYKFYWAYCAYSNMRKIQYEEEGWCCNIY